MTVTVNVLVVTLPTASVAVSVTVVTPFAKTVPEAGLALTVTPGQLSVAATGKVTTAEHWPGSVDCEMLAGVLMTGAWLSITVTVKEQEAVFPCESVAMLLTMVVPFGKVEPEGGVERTVAEPQVSVAVTVKFTTAEHWPASLFTVMFGGHVTTGGVVSRTVIVRVLRVVLPALSVAV